MGQIPAGPILSKIRRNFNISLCRKVLSHVNFSSISGLSLRWIALQNFFHFGFNLNSYSLRCGCKETHMESDTSRLTWSRQIPSSMLLKQWFRKTSKAVCSWILTSSSSSKQDSNTLWKKCGNLSLSLRNAYVKYWLMWRGWVDAKKADFTCHTCTLSLNFSFTIITIDIICAIEESGL